ncbi:hypothetical protein M422DRAFT_261805 [Sphaerobolus stellatus SS14]|uniref:Uncharacterized protein n=1 Tax=Sphaerobolus stellatus (strain SS14) TaxID=990650 RepID=A0A0C9TZM6_SPHS4|nr:hypothetical protein M422DRAFT_261805 [Sphaerobolus stellatus SS14]
MKSAHRLKRTNRVLRATWIGAQDTFPRPLRPAHRQRRRCAARTLGHCTLHDNNTPRDIPQQSKAATAAHRPPLLEHRQAEVDQPYNPFCGRCEGREGPA